MLVLLGFVYQLECVHELQLHTQVANGAHWELDLDAVQVNRGLIGLRLRGCLIDGFIYHRTLPEVVANRLLVGVLADLEPHVLIIDSAVQSFLAPSDFIRHQDTNCYLVNGFCLCLKVELHILNTRLLGELHIVLVESVKFEHLLSAA